MKIFRSSVVLAVAAASLSLPMIAQGPPQGGGPGGQGGPGGPGGRPQGYVQHNVWKKGHRLPQQDWSRGKQVDWRSNRLRQPPRGYEWRRIDGNFVLASIATGVIASAIIASSGH